MKTGLKRDKIDKFYTKKHIVKMCFSLINSYLQINKNELIIEPSAGGGAFIKPIKQLSDNYKFYDIEPDHDEIEQQDYLSLDTTNLQNCHVIGNPPFGRQASLARQFITKSCTFCKSLSFILPKSFKKDSMQKTFPLNFHLVLEVDIPSNAFSVSGVDHDVPCIFQIWEKKDKNRKEKPILKPDGYEFVKKNENPDLSFRRVGVYAGKLTDEIDDKSEQSHYFIKLKSYSKEEFLQKYEKIIFEGDNTVGPKSISKQELMFEINENF
jgi:hypothetical protein